MSRQNMNEIYKMHGQEETSLVPVLCNPYECNRDCGNRQFMASYKEWGYPTPKAPCIPTEKE